MSLLPVGNFGPVSSAARRASGPAPTPPPTDYALYWSFAHVAAGVVADESPNGRDGTMQGGASIIASPQGHAVLCDGVDGRVTSTYLGTGAYGVTGTVAAWVRYDNDVQDDPFGTLYIASEFAVGQGFNGDMGLTRANVSGAGDRVYAYAYSGGSQRASAPYTKGEWTHFAWWLDSTTLKLFKNGVLADSAPCGSVLNQGMAFLVGNHAGTRFAGAAGEVRVYERSLTDDEVMALYTFGG